MMDYSIEPPPKLLSRIGQRARQLRIARNLTQRELAERSGVGSATIERFERAGRVSLENALRVAIALGVEDAFEHLFEAPKYRSIDEALQTRVQPIRKRVRKRR